MTDPIHNIPVGMPRLLALMARLRDPESGCPWDIEQTPATIAPYTIEEAYEVADAVERNDMSDLRAELGDLLLQVVYFAQMADEAGHFTFDHIAEGITQKMIDRHPHVFGSDTRDKSAAQQTRDWEVQKAAERARRGETRVLDGVAMGLPALMRAEKLQKRAARVGFDWESAEQVLDKLVEEAREFTAAENADEAEDEMGDLLFVMANLARHHGIDPEVALRRANAKFTRRFNAMEAHLAAQGERPEALDLEALEALWQAAKRGELIGQN